MDMVQLRRLPRSTNAAQREMTLCGSTLAAPHLALGYMSFQSSSAFPLPEAQLVAFFMQSVSYGVHVATFSMCMFTWIKSRDTPRTSRSWPWVAVAVALFFTGTIDVAFHLYHNLLAFAIYDGGQDAQGVFGDLSGWINVMRVSSTVSSTT